jgi:hypothetical protein
VHLECDSWIAERGISMKTVMNVHVVAPKASADVGTGMRGLGSLCCLLHQLSVGRVQVEAAAAQAAMRESASAQAADLRSQLDTAAREAAVNRAMTEGWQRDHQVSQGAAWPGLMSLTGWAGSCCCNVTSAGQHLNP